MIAVSMIAVLELSSLLKGTRLILCKTSDLDTELNKMLTKITPNYHQF